MDINEILGEFDKLPDLPLDVIASLVKKTGVPRTVASFAALMRDELVQKGFTRGEAMELIVLTVKNLLDAAK